MSFAEQLRHIGAENYAKEIKYKTTKANLERTTDKCRQDIAVAEQANSEKTVNIYAKLADMTESSNNGLDTQKQLLRDLPDYW